MARLKHGTRQMYERHSCRCETCKRAHRRRLDEARRVRQRSKLSDGKTRSGRVQTPAWMPDGTMTREQYLRQREAEPPRRAALRRRWYIPTI